jgi:UDP-GlcNAc:undecaprenyl-phosphate GlcNAc-1-phosphate transferase
MPSFSGSNLAGYYLGILSILSTTKVGTLLIVLGIPLIDTAYTVVRRILSGKSPVWGDRGHLHHKLLDLGLSKKQVSYFYWISTALLGIMSLYLNSAYKLYTVIGIAILLGGFFIWLKFQSKS